jgi:hypothetical protein
VFLEYFSLKLIENDFYLQDTARIKGEVVKTSPSA